MHPLTIPIGPTTMKDEERVKMVQACKWADEVVFGVPYTPTIELLNSLNCDFGVHGDDIPTNAEGNSAYAEIIKAGRCKIIKRTEGVSTTTLVGRLLLMTREHHMPSESENLQLSATEHQHNHHVTTSSAADQFLPTTQRLYLFSKFAEKNYIYNTLPKVDPQCVVYIDGAFDLFHIGHVEALEEAKKMGDFLLVGVHSDKTVNEAKGKNYPIMNLHERVLNVLSCKFVDEVILGAPWIITQEMVTTMRIGLVVNLNASNNLDYNLKVNFTVILFTVS